MADEFTTYTKSKKKLKEFKFTPKATIEDKKGTRKSYRLKAVKLAEEQWGSWIKDRLANKGPNKTICLFIFAGPAGDLDFKIGKSGTPEGIKANLSAVRKVCDIDADKKSVCAEEHIIAEEPTDTLGLYLFSIAATYQHCRGGARLVDYAGQPLPPERARR